jgi:tripartite-type tricarboxylate transporter receptor subunit TctC
MMSGVDLLNVPYKSQTQAIVDLMGGRIDISFTDVVTGLPALQSGKVRALATTGLERIATLADVPTVAEAGLPGYELNAWAAVYMPAGTPAAIVERLKTHIKPSDPTPIRNTYVSRAPRPSSAAPRN